MRLVGVRKFGNAQAGIFTLSTPQKQPHSAFPLSALESPVAKVSPLTLQVIARRNWLFLAALVSAFAYGCDGCDGGRSNRVDTADGAVEGGTPDAGPWVIPGTRPTLSSPGEVVPLLWGRAVEVHAAATDLDVRFALDDPMQPAYQRFFLALNAACMTSFAEQVEPPDGGLVLPGCAGDGAFQARLHLCRAAAGGAFASGEGAGLVGDERNPELNLPEQPGSGEELYATTSKDSQVRASWGLFAVAEFREAIATASFALDPASCRALEDRDAELLASALREAVDALPAHTETAATLLRAALSEVHKGAADDADTRMRVTRGLNDSLLEQQKLYTGVPYGLFTPVDAARDAERSDRYPVLLESPGPAASRAATLISVSSTRCADDEGKVLDDAALGLNFVAALRAHEPLLLGHVSKADVSGVLARFALTLEEVRAGAKLVLARRVLSGTPVVPLASHEVTAGLAIEHPDALATRGYVQAITGARATRNDEDLRSYAMRGLAHARDAARLAASRALTRADLPASARDDLSLLRASAEASAGTLQICVSAGTPSVTTLTLELPDAAGTDDYEIWRGELGAACAFEAGCESDRYQVASVPKKRSEFVLDDSGTNGRFYVTARGLDGATREGRLIVAAVSTKPLDEPRSDHCYFEPLSSAMHVAMRNLHDRAPLSVVLRTYEPWTAGSRLTPIDADPVSPLLDRKLPAVNDQGTALSIELAEPFATEHMLWERGFTTLCAEGPALLDGKAARECGAAGLARASALDCQASWAHTLLDRQARSARLDGLTVQIGSQVGPLTLRLWAWERTRRALIAAADVLDADLCKNSPATKAVGNQALTMIARLLDAAEADLPLLEVALEAEADAARAGDSSDVTRRVLRTRGLTQSRLATARLFVNLPRSAYEPAGSQGGSSDAFDHALTRFPVVTRDAVLAEDVRAEAFLRRTELQPWLADLSVQAGAYDPVNVSSTLAGTGLTLRLRARLAELDAAKYSSLPHDAPAILTTLGISAVELQDAAIRISQTAEARGTSLLPLANTDPLLASGMDTHFPAPNGAQLVAQSGGRLMATVDALRAHFALRGHYHTLAYLARALREAPASVAGNALDAIQDVISEQVQDTVVIEQHSGITQADALSIELTVGPNTSDDEALAQTALVFSDAGLSCVLTSAIGGRACATPDFVFDASLVKVTTLSGATGSRRRLRLDGYRFPNAKSWLPQHALELTRGRVYLVRETGAGWRAVAGVTVAAKEALPVRHEAPSSEAMDLHVLELLAFKAPGEGCAACRPRSVCETTRCELDLCVREAALDGESCGASAVCKAGECSMPGCGDGTRADGSDAVPYEACDDGNLNDGDGCTSACLPELRSLEPLIQEGWPGGPAPAVGIDGLGQQLLVYTADALSGDNQLIRGALLDAHGVQAGTERTLDDNLPRVFIANPCVAGLRDGGFAVVYGSNDIDHEAGIGVRIVSSTGNVGELLRVDEGNATAGRASVASVEDGFVVAWNERSGNALLSRVRARRFDSQGAPIGSSFDVAGATPLVDQVEPTVSASLGQFLIAWTERSADDGSTLSLQGRRFFPYGSPVDGDAFEIAGPGASEPALTVLRNDDYLVAWTDRAIDSEGDIMRRKVQRFGLPLSADQAEIWVSGAEAQTTPVIAGLGDDAVLAYASGAPRPITGLVADSADANAAVDLAANLATARERDVSTVSTPLGAWVVWSVREAQGRALYAYLLPADDAP